MGWSPTAPGTIQTSQPCPPIGTSYPNLLFLQRLLPIVPACSLCSQVQPPVALPVQHPLDPQAVKGRASDLTRPGRGAMCLARPQLWAGNVSLTNRVKRRKSKQRCSRKASSRSRASGRWCGPGHGEGNRGRDDAETPDRQGGSSREGCSQRQSSKSHIIPMQSQRERGGRWGPGSKRAGEAQGRTWTRYKDWGVENHV